MRLKKRPRTELNAPVDEETELTQLEQRVLNEAPPKGTQAAAAGGRQFSQLPLSRRTLQGLESGKFDSMTEIQAASIPHALAGRDVLGAASTGSGKTLAFLVPLLEKLHRMRWTFGDGLGALVVSPTRELALQIFEVLRVVGGKHLLSAGLIVGGKRDFTEEQAMVSATNILIATPGRLLQHLEQTPGFDASQLQVLVLDEADRLLDMGFREQLNSVLTYLPLQRQTMLFSATQTRSVKDLARLSLNRDTVEYISAQLVQNYVVCELRQKLDVLYSFLKTHIKSKTIVFFSSCAQVRFVHELLCALQPGVPLLALHGKLKQQKRTQIYFDYVRKASAVLFATDVAARGLDFPAVDWVIQADAPEDAASYIHRAGRTARYKSGGRALLLLLPSEEKGMVAALSKQKIPITRLTVNPDKMRAAGSVTARASSAVAADADKRRLAEKAFHSYVRSVQLMPDRRTFGGGEGLDLAGFATSLGLPAPPRLKGAVIAAAVEGEEGREEVRAKKNVNRSLQRLKEQIRAERALKRAQREGLSAAAPEAPKAKKTSASSAVLNGGSKSALDDGSSQSDDGSGDDLLVVKSREVPGDASDGSGADEAADRARSRKKKAKEPKQRINQEGIAVAAAAATKVVFNEAGEGVRVVDPSDRFAASNPAAAAAASDLSAAAAAHAERIRARLRATEAGDRERERERLRAKRLKARDKAARKTRSTADGGGAAVATLGGSGSSGGSGSESGGGSDDGIDSDGSGGGAESDADAGGGEDDLEARVLRMMQR
ncbi:DEAD box helicase [Tribonema minus]|uniref:ATP-dependent RNA helicase n=1 Tax=Tribonema minus TaxID=303371 RepID=A0A836CCM6_9STRA|nr:DEAD box helicase [Tribonema minus]